MSKPQVVKIRVEDKDGKWETKNTESLSVTKEMMEIKAESRKKPPYVKIELPTDWSTEDITTGKGDSAYVLMKIPKVNKRVRKAAKKVAKKTAAKKTAKKATKTATKKAVKKTAKAATKRTPKTKILS